MFANENIAMQPLFYLFIAFSFLLGLGFFWGKRINRNIFLSAFNDLVKVINPVDQTFTNIGGLIGFHANFITAKKSPVEKVDATITLLPRQSLLYLPVSKLIWKYDRLFITIHLKNAPVAEGHLIEIGYARFRGPKITNADRMEREVIKWGGRDYFMYYEQQRIRDMLARFVSDNPDPGAVRHIALVPPERRCFVFMIPHRGEVAKSFGPVYNWVISIFKN
jgi:hypothetical protein